MKQKYFSPEFEVTLLFAEDVLTASLELKDEVEIDGGGLFDPN